MTEAIISEMAKVRHFPPYLGRSIEGLLQFMPAKALGRPARWIPKLIRAWLLACPMIGDTFVCGQRSDDRNAYCRLIICATVSEATPKGNAAEHRKRL
jgi:hypothetical protein